MDNYEFCVEYAVARANGRPLKVLDYGCGRGLMVRRMRDRGVDAYGCEVFYGGGDVSTEVPGDMLGRTVLEMRDGVVPFPDRTFDLVINNQVMEHVVDLDQALDEIHRVLTPSGAVLSLFPDRLVWREGHCGVPFLHWFPKGSRLRVYYAFAFRCAGFGYHKGTTSRWQWANQWCDWLDRWTHYRSYDDIVASYRRRFSTLQHIEADWFVARTGAWAKWIPANLRSFAARYLAHLTFECRDPV